jgi:DNA (cytosine-5)-methyltransferase 1
MYPMVSLFTGAGGLDLGLEKAGFETRACVEILKCCHDTLELNRFKKKSRYLFEIFNDIREVDPKELLKSAKLREGEAVLLAGGPPCQSFSTAGKRGSIEDPRGSLFIKYIELVEAIKPRFFIMENVRGILSAALKHRPLDRRGTEHPPLEPGEELGSLLKLVVLPAIKERLGYQLTYGLLNAANYGTPQVRERVIFIGSRDNELGPTNEFGELKIEVILPPTHAKNPKSGSGLKHWKTLGYALKGLEDPAPEYTPYSEARCQTYKLVPEGGNWRYLRDNYGDEFVKEVMGGAYSSTGGRVGFWRRLSFSKPCPTLVASPVQKSTGLCHPSELRPLSVKEYARVQQFDDGYVFSGAVADKYLQIGNAVPVGFAEYIGRKLSDIINSNTHIAEERSTYCNVN